MMHAFNISTQEAETGRYLWASDQPRVLSKFKASLGYLVSSRTARDNIVGLCLEKSNQIKQQQQ